MNASHPTGSGTAASQPTAPAATRQLGDAVTPLFVQVRDALRAEILAGRLAPGSRLPSESELIARYGVSRITVRQALSGLQEAGLVATVNGKGSYVTRPDRARSHGPMVGVLEVMRRRGHRAHGRLVSHRTVAAGAEVAAALQRSRRTPVGALVVLRYRDDVPFAIGTTWCDAALAERLAAQDLSEIDVMVALEDRLGVRVARTQVSVEATLAGVRVARQLQYEPAAPVLRIRTLSYDYHGQPVAFSVTDARGDMMDYRVTLRR
jgi:GntR family transcriptional regulator